MIVVICWLAYGRAAYEIDSLKRSINTGIMYMVVWYL